MTCWMKYINNVKNYLATYNVNDQEARQILEDVERQVGHNPVLIKAVVDKEKDGLIRRLRKKKKEMEMAYT